MDWIILSIFRTYALHYTFFLLTLGNVLAKRTLCLVVEGTLEPQGRSQGPTVALPTALRSIGGGVALRSTSTTVVDGVVAEGGLGTWTVVAWLVVVLDSLLQLAHCTPTSGLVTEMSWCLRVQTADDSRLANKYIAMRTFSGLRNTACYRTIWTDGMARPGTKPTVISTYITHPSVYVVTCTPQPELVPTNKVVSRQTKQNLQCKQSISGDTK